jgi:hypothetical protein
MATTCTNCGCSKAKCGCQDTMLTTPAPCPTPIGCPDPLVCSEIFDAQCVVYTGDDIICEQDIVVEQNTNIADALNDIIDYFCNIVPQPPLQTIVEGDITTNVSSSTVNNVTTYTVSIEDTGWVDLDGFVYYQGAMATQKPQCRRIGKQIHFRGDLYVPLFNEIGPIPITAPDTYRTVNRKTPYTGTGGIYIDADDNMYFNRTGASGGVVIPTSVLPAPTNLDGTYKLGRRFASRQFQVFNSIDPDEQQEGTVLFNSVVEISILSNKQLRLTPIETLERNANDEVSFEGSSILRKLTSSFIGRSFIYNFNQYLFAQDGANSNPEALQYAGGLTVGRAYYIESYVAGDNFTNVGAVSNLPGQFFIATGTTPTTWTNGSGIAEVPQVIEGYDYFYKNIIASQNAARFELLIDGTGLNSSLASDLGGFVISLDGLMGYIA